MPAYMKIYRFLDKEFCYWIDISNNLTSLFLSIYSDISISATNFQICKYQLYQIQNKENKYFIVILYNVSSFTLTFFKNRNRKYLNNVHTSHSIVVVMLGDMTSTSRNSFQCLGRMWTQPFISVTFLVQISQIQNQNHCRPNVYQI